MRKTKIKKPLKDTIEVTRMEPATAVKFIWDQGTRFSLSVMVDEPRI